MTEAEGKKPFHLLIVCSSQELGETLIEELSGEGGREQATLTFDDGESAFVEVLAGDPRLNPTWEETVGKARGMVILARFLDVMSLDKLKSIYRHLPPEERIMLSVGLFRQNGETEFKMSCPACGQKLWVKDDEAGKRGRCPNCRKAFKLPSQPDLIRSQLMLPDAIPVHQIKQGDRESALRVFRDLVNALNGGILPTGDQIDQSTLKNTTVRVQLSPEDYE